MKIIFESERILFIRPEMELIPDYLEMVNDIEYTLKEMTEGL